jgi:ketosteroid isomerase-like protein
MRRSTIAALAVLVLGVGCKTKTEGPATQQGNAVAPTVDVAAVRQQVEAGNAGLIAAMEKGDATAAAGFYDDSAMTMPPGQDASVGRANILKMFGSFSAFTITNMRLVVRDIVASGDLASETGHYEWTVTPKAGGAKPMTDMGKYLVVWKKQGDGSYKLFRDIWNNDAPVAPTKK